MDPLLGGLISGGLSLLSGFGAKQSAAKQSRQQIINDNAANYYNEQQIAAMNAARRHLGERLLETPQWSKESNIQENRSWVDTDAMMMAAERAGFNPVTFLNAGGLAAYTQSNTTSYRESSGNDPVAAFQMMMPTANQRSATQAANIPSVMSIVGDAGQAALKSYQADARLQDSQAFQERLLNLKLSQLQQPSSKSRSGLDTGFGSTPRTGGSGTSLVSSVLPFFARQGGLAPDVKAPEVTDIGYYGWKQDPRLPSGQVIEDTYTEVGSWPFSAFKAANDVWYNASLRGYGPKNYALIDAVGDVAGKFNTTVTKVDPASPWSLKINGKEWVPSWQSPFRNPNYDQPFFGLGQ